MKKASQSATFNPAYFWLNSAIFRNGSTSQTDWSWVWNSPTDTLTPINYKNWATGHSKLFTSDSIYLNTTDLKFYVNPNTVLTNTGLVCQTSIVSLSSSQLSVTQISSSTSYSALSLSSSSTTCDSVCSTLFTFSVNITLNGTISANQINAPNANTYSTALLGCSKTLISNQATFALNQSFFIDICGALKCNFINGIISNLVDAWLQARPGK